MSSSLKVAVAGLGTVGAGVVRILQQNAETITARCGREIEVVAVSSRDRTKDRGIDTQGLMWAEDARALADLDGVDVVVETIGGSEGIAKDLVLTALDAGKAVVTANKALLAIHAKTLAERGGVLAFEAAVAGGIPAIKGLREGLAANNFRRVYGHLNGTCNYIMTAMTDEGRDYSDVLAEAQALGYAEADPTFDVGGIDAAHKLAIVSSIAYRCPVDVDAIMIEGIDNITSADIAAAAEFNCKIKLIAMARPVEIDGKTVVAQWVRPCLVDQSMMVAQIDGVTNALIADGDFVGEVVLQGPGAGAGPTASAVVADIIDIARGNTQPPFPPVGALVADADAWKYAPAAFYLRCVVHDRPGVLARVAGDLGDAGISIKAMVQSTAEAAGDPVTLTLMTHSATWHQLLPVLDQLNAHEDILAPVQALHVLAKGGPANG